MDIKNPIEVWEQTGIEPDDDRKEKGFEGGYHPPGSIFNFLFNRITVALQEAQEKIRSIVYDDAPTKNSKNIAYSGGIYTALEGKLTTKKISPTSDYIDFVIPLCCLDNTDATYNTYFRGVISLKRDNGAGERVCHIEAVCSKVYDTETPSYSIRGHIPSNMPVFPVKFLHNGKPYYGIYFKNTSSRYNIGSVYGYASHWSVIECIGLYNYNTSTILNTEIYNSIEYLESENSVPQVFLNTPYVRMTNADKTGTNYAVYHTGNKPTPSDIGAVPLYKTSDYCQSAGWYRAGILTMNATSGSAAANIVVGGQFNNNQTGTFIVKAVFAHNHAALQQLVGCGLSDSTTHLRLNRISATQVAVEFYYDRTSANTVHISVQPEMGTFSLLPEVIDVTAEQADEIAIIELYNSETYKFATMKASSYTGNGKYGIDNPNKLTFTFKPKIIMFFDNGTASVSVMNVYGLTSEYKKIGIFTTYGVYARIIDDTVEWYSTESADYQHNIDSYGYSYVAFG